MQRRLLCSYLPRLNNAYSHYLLTSGCPHLFQLRYHQCLLQGRYEGFSGWVLTSNIYTDVFIGMSVGTEKEHMCTPAYMLCTSGFAHVGMGEGLQPMGSSLYLQLRAQHWLFLPQHPWPRPGHTEGGLMTKGRGPRCFPRPKS